MKRGLIIGGGVLVLAVVGYLIFGRGDAKPKEAPKVELPTGPDPAHLARVAELVKQIDDLETKGKFKDALAALQKLAALEPKDPRLASYKPRLEEKLRRFEAWKGAHQRAEEARADAARRKTRADWQKAVDACAEAEKHAPAEEFQKLTRALAIVSGQHLDWMIAQEEEKKGNVAGALDLVIKAIAAAEPPAELTAYKAVLEKKKRKLEFERAASAARSEVVQAKSYELWQKARSLAEDPKDMAEVDAKIHALKPFVDPAERDRRFDEAIKAGDTALAAGQFDAAEKAFKDARALKSTDPKPAQALTRLGASRKQKAYDTALAEARAAEGKREWADAIEAYDRAFKIKLPDSKLTAHRNELEENYRPARIVVVLSEPTNIKMEFVLIKRGKFMMGDAQGDGDEKPREVVIEKDFWMQTTELTQAHWSIVMNTKPWLSSSIPHLPVEGVSWDDAQKFFETMNAMAAAQLQGRKASLPTEAEWEYGCRAGTTTRWSFGNDETQLDLYGWFTKSGGRAPQTVANKRPNPWGLFDMHGNLAEWVADGYAANSDKAAAEASQYKVVRGGSWNDRAATCRSAKRERDVPTKSSLFVGFRAVLR